MTNYQSQMISVVIPLYNKEKSIISTIESVLAQTYKDWELIVVDDGSTDNSLDVLKEYLSKLQITNHQLQILTQCNSGVSAARNRGIMEASGEYVAFLDGDDLWDKDFLKEMMQLIKDFPDKSIYGLGCEKILDNQIPQDDQWNYYRGETHWEWDTMAYSGSSSCVNKKDAIAAGLFDTRMTHGEDWDMWWRLQLKNGGACYTKPFAYYRQDAENRAMNKIIPLEKHIPYYIDEYEEVRKNNAEFRRFFDREMIYRLYPYLFEKQYKKEAKLLASKLDYSQLKISLKLRMIFPHLYRLFTGR